MEEEQKDWYTVLGVERAATTKEITKAYRLKALKYHPDKNPDPNAAKIFHDLSQAYDLLLDPAARAAFDNLLKVKVQARERTDKYDSARRKMKEDLDNRENAFKKQQQDEQNEKAAAMRMHYEMERLKQENLKKRAEEQLKQENIQKRAEERLKQENIKERAEREAEDTKSLDTSLWLKWKKKKRAFDADELVDIFKQYGSVDSCLSKKPGLALISFRTLTGAYAAMRASEREDKELTAFTIAWASGAEPIAVAALRSKESSPSISTSASTSPPSSAPSSAKLQSSVPQSAFNVSTSFTPAFSAPAFSISGASFGTFSSQIPSFGGAPPAPKITDDYEAATLARMKSKDNERKRLAEEMMRLDKEEEERLQAVAAAAKDKKQKV